MGRNFVAFLLRLTSQLAGILKFSNHGWLSNGLKFQSLVIKADGPTGRNFDAFLLRLTTQWGGISKPFY